MQPLLLYALLPPTAQPFISRIRALFEANGVSTVLVVGGSGDYFDVADKVIMMDSYTPIDVTERAKEVSRGGGAASVLACAAGAAAPLTALGIVARAPRRESFAVQGKTVARRLDIIQWGEAEINLTCVEQLVEVRLGPCTLCLVLSQPHPRGCAPTQKHGEEYRSRTQCMRAVGGGGASAGLVQDRKGGG